MPGAMPNDPPEITVAPLAGEPPRARVRVPGSKSLTNRALIVAALADGPSTLTGALDSDDTRVMVDSLQRLGLHVEHDPAAATIAIQGCSGRIPAREADLYIANSGTSLRFLTAMVAIGRGTYRLDGVARMRERPIGDLLDALRQLGVDARSEPDNGCAPVRINANGIRGGHVRIRADKSSQYLSGLLLVLPFAWGDTTVEIDGPVMMPPCIRPG